MRGSSWTTRPAAPAKRPTRRLSGTWGCSPALARPRTQPGSSGRGRPQSARVRWAAATCGCQLWDRSAGEAKQVARVPGKRTPGAFVSSSQGNGLALSWLSPGTWIPLVGWRKSHLPPMSRPQGGIPVHRPIIVIVKPNSLSEKEQPTEFTPMCARSKRTRGLSDWRIKRRPDPRQKLWHSGSIKFS
jgi:hypothetical protein